MEKTQDYCVVLVTAPDLDGARKLARAALEARLVACANLLPGIESHFWWRGELESDPEILIFMKTSFSCLDDLEVLVLKNHPYDTPEIIAVPIEAGHSRYLAWISQSLESQ